MKIKTCGLCQKEINLEKDTYVHLIDYKDGKFLMEGYYHHVCWDKKFNVANQMKGKVFGLVKKAEDILGIKEEAYEIR